MTLEVPLEGFVAAAKRLAPGAPTFVAAENGGSRISCADPSKDVRVLAYSPESPAAARETLKAEGVEAFEGRWIPDDAPAASGEIYVAAVAYRTEGSQPGLWVDAYQEHPSSVQAITTMYEEFRETGQVAEIPLEEFVRLAEPTVVVVSPAELRGFASAKDC